MKNMFVLALVGLLALAGCAAQSCPGGYASSNWCSMPAGGVSDSN